MFFSAKFLEVNAPSKYVLIYLYCFILLSRYYSFANSLLSCSMADKFAPTFVTVLLLLLVPDDILNSSSLISIAFS